MVDGVWSQSTVNSDINSTFETHIWPICSENLFCFFWRFLIFLVFSEKCLRIPCGPKMRTLT